MDGALQLRGRGPEISPAATSGSWLRLKCRLPSPTWPYAISRPSGTWLLIQLAARCTNWGQGADRHRDVVFEACAVQALRAREVLAQEPEAVGLTSALRNRSVAGPDLPHGPRRGSPSRIVFKRSSARGEVSSHSNVPVVPRQWIHRVFDMPYGQVQRQAWQQFKGADAITTVSAQAT